MADFAEWVAACEGDLFPAGSFLRAYRSNRERAISDLVEADPVANAIRALMTSRGSWTGTATELLAALAITASASGSPETPRALAGRLRRAATFLRELGIEVVFLRSGRSRTRVISLRRQTVT